MTALTAMVSGLLLAAVPSPPPSTHPRPSAPSKGSSRQVYFEQTTRRTVDGRAMGVERARVWCAGPRLRMERVGVPAGEALILRLDQGRAYRIDPAARTAYTVDLARLGEASRADLESGGTSVAQGRVRTTPLATPRQVAGHACRGWRLVAGEARMDVYVARDVPAGVEAFASFLRWSGAEERLPGLLAALRKLPGFPLETRSRLVVSGSVQETVATLTSVRVGPVETARFEPPRGFALADDPAPGAPEGRP